VEFGTRDGTVARSEPRELRVPGSVVPGDVNPLTTDPVPDDIHVAWTQAQHLPNVREPQVYARYNRQLTRWRAAQLGAELFGLDPVRLQSVIDFNHCLLFLQASPSSSRTVIRASGSWRRSARPAQRSSRP